MGQILVKILAGLMTEKLFRALIANGLEIVVKHTDTDIDNQMIDPIIKALRGE